jgi:alpha-galactosidase
MKNEYTKGEQKMKLVLIGGGSYAWTHTFITDIAFTPSLKGMHIVLQDIDPAPLKIVVPLCRKISSSLRADLQIEGMTDLESALRGADFVGLTISTGGNELNAADLVLPAKYGIHQTVGDTVGPGGWMRALRNIPVVVEIIRKVERIAPNAWFMNYTNPMTILTHTLRKVSSIRSFGICHEIQGLLLHLAYYFGVDWLKDITFSMAGINHLIWILSMNIKGQNGLELFKEYARDPEHFKRVGNLGVPIELSLSGGLSSEETKRYKTQEELYAASNGGSVPTIKVKHDLLERTGCLPAAGDSHIAEFFSHYLRTEDEMRRWGFVPGERAHAFARHGSADERRQHCEDMLNGKVPLPLHHSHEHADKTIAALAGVGEPFTTPVNLPNMGQIDNLPRQAVVETMAYVDQNGLHPLAVGALPPALVHYLTPHITNQEMIVEAGLTGNQEMAVLALANDPLVPHPDIAEKIAEDYFENYRSFLPQFYGKWLP